MPPREAWLLECVQEDTNNVKPCNPADIAKWGKDGQGVAKEEPKTKKEPSEVVPAVDHAADAGAEAGSFEDNLMQQMLGGSGDAGAPVDAEAKPADDMEKLMEEMMNAGKDKDGG